MIDERKEELAALYALDLLQGAERSSFEAELSRDPELQKLVGENICATGIISNYSFIASDLKKVN